MNYNNYIIMFIEQLRWQCLFQKKLRVINYFKEMAKNHDSLCIRLNPWSIYVLLQKKYEDVSKERDKVSHLAKSLKEQLNKANTAQKEEHDDKVHSIQSSVKLEIKCRLRMLPSFKGLSLYFSGG